MNKLRDKYWEPSLSWNSDTDSYANYNEEFEYKYEEEERENNTISATTQNKIFK